ncbi:MFS transporter [Paraburkholderia sp. C35]|uniref:MFS transporter n=1 Tax=Paraburkholderia sp. C35 TaxID=2126993 RepID=UPI000D69AD9D|nr:MFS transporter [Paraburkholderia sp. C35]
MELSDSPGKSIDVISISGSQYVVVVLCALCMVVDGFDVQAMSYAAPTLIKDCGISKAMLGPVLSAGLFGMLVGSVLLAGIADRIGRRPALIVSLLWVAILMGATPLVHTVSQLVMIRFVAGLGMGIVVPNALALGGEYSPPRLRTTLVMAVSSGYVIGGVVGGLIAAFVIKPFGWVGVFYSGALLTTFLTLMMLRYLPESLQFRLLRRPDDASTFDLIRKYQLEDDLNPTEKVAGKESSLKVVFGHGRTRPTVLLWLASFCNMLSAYFLAAWIPLLMSSIGFSASASLLAGMAFWGGGLVGNYILGYQIDRFGYGWVMIGNFILGGLSIAGLALFTHQPEIATLCIVFAGFSVIGGQSGLYGIAVIFYPTKGRSTGAGLASGIGRIGAVLGPILGGHLLTLSWTADQIILASAGPTLVTALSIGLLGSISRAKRTAALSEQTVGTSS